MRAGALRHRVTLQQATESQNSFGEVERVWTDVATVWASVEQLSGREFIEARQVDATLSTRIRMRWRNGVTEKMRVVWTDPSGRQHTYNIVSVIADATHRRELMLMCQEVLS